MREAISTHVKPGQMLFFSGGNNGEPTAAIYEIVRQRIEHLSVISFIVYFSLEIMISEGLIDRVIAGYLQQDEKVKAYMPLAKARGRFPKVQETSHLGLSLALMAGQMNVPFLPTRALRGSDLVTYNEEITDTVCPFTGVKVAAVKAVQPDVGILMCQRADAQGNAQKWGSRGMDAEGIGASKTVIVVAEEIVDSDVIRREPNLTIVPGFRVAAVVHQPWGGYPNGLAGCYNTAQRYLMPEIRGREGFENWIRENVHGCSDWNEFLEKRRQKLGDEHFQSLRIQNPLYSTPIITGY
jgi:glutaconate CoA-transferase subunit A